MAYTKLQTISIILLLSAGFLAFIWEFNVMALIAWVISLVIMRTRIGK
jgi:hypothetical protein